jgi:hypothetical protein
VLWFNKETFEQWLNWMLLLEAIRVTSDRRLSLEQAQSDLAECQTLIGLLERAAQESGYRVSKLIDASRGGFAVG